MQKLNDQFKIKVTTALLNILDSKSAAWRTVVKLIGIDIADEIKPVNDFLYLDYILKDA